MPVVANAVIGIIITMIWKPGDGSRVAPIGNRRIGTVGTMVKFGNVSRNVMVPPVLLLVVFILLLFFVCVMTMCVIKSFIYFFFVSIFFHMN